MGGLETTKELRRLHNLRKLDLSETKIALYTC